MEKSAVLLDHDGDDDDDAMWHLFLESPLQQRNE